MSTMVSQIAGLFAQPLFSGADKENSKAGPCEGNLPVTGAFPSQRASNAESISIWWRHHERVFICMQQVVKSE